MSRQTTRHEMPALIATRTPFQGNSMSATNSPSRYPGWLNDAETERFFADFPSIVYLVKSYDTPIAWVLDDGTTYKVAQRFSMTTSHHQGKLYTLDQSDREAAQS